MKVVRQAEAEAMQWTGANNIEFINWIKSIRGIDWSYDPTHNEFWVSNWDYPDRDEAQVLINNCLVVEDHPELDNLIFTVYSSVGWNKQGMWHELA